MEGRHFDELVRRLAGRDDRRRLLRGAAGATLALLAVRLPAGAAQQTGTIALGEACQRADQCLQDYMGSEIVCADNGVAKDGSSNCCRDDGCCTRDADCCGDRLCAPSGDVCSYCALPPFPSRLLGETCDANEQCVPSVVGPVICADNGIAKDGAKNCCFEAGGACAPGQHHVCCGDLRCVEDRCQDSVTVAETRPLYRGLVG
jgi:hypothetical protein